MRKLVLTMSIGALAVLFSAGAFAEEANTPAAPQTTPQVTPLQQKSALRDPQAATRSAGAKPVKPLHRQAQAHHRRAMTGQTARATTSGGGKNAEAAASAPAPSTGRMAIASHTPTRHHRHAHHRPATTAAPAPSSGTTGGMPRNEQPASVK